MLVKSFFIPWVIIIVFNILRRKLLKNTIINNNKVLGKGFWVSLSFGTPFLAYGIMQIANQIYQLSFLSTYLLTVALLGLFIISLQFIFFKEIIWRDLFKMWLRLTTIFTIILNLFFVILSIAV